MKKAILIISTVLLVSVMMTTGIFASSYNFSRYDSDTDVSDDSMSVQEEQDTGQVFGDPEGLHFITKLEYYSRLGNYKAEVVAPEIKGMADLERQKSLNDYIKSVAYDIIDQFENDARAILFDFPDESPYFSANYGFDFPTDSESVLTLALHYSTVAGSSDSSTSFFNFNKQTRELILMDDYFIPGSDAANLLRDEILKQMRQTMAEDENVVYWIDEKTDESDMMLDWGDLLADVGNNNQYRIDENGDLVIVFNKYDVAPGYMGNPEFVIPSDVVMAMENAMGVTNE